MKRWLWRAPLLLLALGALGFAVVVSGVIPITASSGHFAVTEWFLQFTKKRSVASHSLGVPEQHFAGEAQVLKGAGHFESGCRPCHGAPDLPHPPRVPQAMLPPPPNLSERCRDYDAEELFYIVKHGLKFTGMPAWPSQVRDDEVTAVVAFLRALPGMDGAGYRRLVHGEPSATTPSDRGAEPLEDLPATLRPPRAVIATCGRCHGVDGNGRGNAAFPKLAGQSQQYLAAALEAYANANRFSGMMQPSAAALSAIEIDELARYYSRLDARSAKVEATRGAAAAGAVHALANTSAAIERGAQIARHGIPERRVASCSDCHGPGTERRTPAAPLLAGQYADYLVLQLELFAGNTRGGSPYAQLMDEVAPRMTRDQMRDVALYYASLTRTQQ
jgi:cytochrome c553